MKESVQTGFKNPTVFPNEAFVQKAIHEFFGRAGYLDTKDGYADFVCHHPTSGERWIVEAKGLTSSVGLDFNTGIGQILRRMKEPSWNYGYALPLIPPFVRACNDLPSHVRHVINLHLIFVAENGAVTIIKPGDPIPQSA